MGKLTDILAAGGFGGDDFDSTWKRTEAAGEFDPLPPGEYFCHATSGELDTSSRGTPRYKLAFTVLVGPAGDESHTGRMVWHDLYLTPAALPMAKRDLLKLGIDEPAKMEQPLPLGIRCRVRVALRRDDDGTERNRVVRFEVVGIDNPEPDAFAPTDAAAISNGDYSAWPQEEGHHDG
ncbi:hypothetical protein NG895_18580 [Aeoliella sp. ICT_H6.2]|uniref:DUF669 domain-containing protein n=1 Tax=Aeoliella straminimaris TaxID=2954799 RepID=A0A9X2JHC4_9BACT|nr:hypothetical protein [Aeoliella straminimaris]MCO6045910.1 hypothetical protein [Aeoliella straminimaris]